MAQHSAAQKGESREKIQAENWRRSPRRLNVPTPGALGRWHGPYAIVCLRLQEAATRCSAALRCRGRQKQRGPACSASAAGKIRSEKKKCPLGDPPQFFSLRKAIRPSVQNLFRSTPPIVLLFFLSSPSPLNPFFFSRESVYTSVTMSEKQKVLGMPVSRLCLNHPLQIKRAL